MTTSLFIKNLWGVPLLVLSTVAVLPPTQATANHLVASTFRRVDATITGRVADEQGKPLPGATVVVKGNTGLGTGTDTDGRFSLTVPTGNETLVVSSIGYVTQELALGGKTDLNVRLVVDNQSLDEVVVVG